MGFEWKAWHVVVLSSGALAAAVGAFYAETEGYIDFVPEKVDEDIPATVTIEDEGYTMGRKWRPGRYWFTATIEGEQERFSVPRSAADAYDPGDKVEVTYDRDHWRDGSTTVSGVQLK